jgi:hypothetical protein
MRLAWEQRYTNSPGNLVWAPLFLIHPWSDKFKAVMFVIGILAAIVSVLTLLSNCVTLAKTSTSTRKLLMGAWGIGILILIGLEVLAVIFYLTSGNPEIYND